MVLTNQLIYLVNVKTIFQIIFASEKVRTLLKKQTLVKTLLIGSLFFPVTVFLSIPFNKLPWYRRSKPRHRPLPGKKKEDRQTRERKVFNTF